MQTFFSTILILCSIFSICFTEQQQRDPNIPLPDYPAYAKALIGNWNGISISITAVPSKGFVSGGNASANDPLRHGFFLRPLKLHDQFIFSSVGPSIPNRGNPGDQFVNAIQYIQTVHGKTTDLGAGTVTIEDEGIHRELGMFLLNDQGLGIDCIRQAVFPHATAFQLTGNLYDLEKGEYPEIEDVNAFPVDLSPFFLNPNGTYLNEYRGFFNHTFGNKDVRIPFTRPNRFLIERWNQIKDEKIEVSKVYVYDFHSMRGVVTAPFIKDQVNIPSPGSFPEITAKFYVLFDKSGKPFELQYFQTILMDFIPHGLLDSEKEERLGGEESPMIRWPHVTNGILNLLN